jgi:hypothetical protein
MTDRFDVRTMFDRRRCKFSKLYTQFSCEPIDRLTDSSKSEIKRSRVSRNVDIGGAGGCRRGLVVQQSQFNAAT